MSAIGSSSLILLSGIPGGGKTTVGNSLERDHGFRHYDFEADRFRMAQDFYANPHEVLAGMDLTKDTVVSWGFGPFEGRDYISILVSAGFTPVWFDGNRSHFFSSFMRREKGDPRMELAYYKQMAAIVETRITGNEDWTVFNPFDAAGKFIPDNPQRILALVR